MEIVHYLPYIGRFQNNFVDLIVKRSNFLKEGLKGYGIEVKQKFSNGYLHQYSYYIVDSFSKFFSSILTSYHIIHVFDFQINNLLLFLTKKIKGYPLIFDVGDLPAKYWKITVSLQNIPLRIISNYLLPLTFRTLIKNSDFIISRGHFLKNLISSAFKIDIEKIDVIYDPISFEKEIFPNYKKGFQIRSKYNLLDKIVVGYSGSLYFLKIGRMTIPRAFEIIKAIELLKRDGLKNISVIITGKGPAFEYIRNYIKKKDLEKEVLLTGFLKEDEYLKHVSAIDIGYLESFKTPGYLAMIGSKLQYYMAFGKVVISSNWGERKILLKNCGILLSPPEPTEKDFLRYVKELKEAIRILSEDEKLRKKLGRKAEEVAKENFDVPVLSKKLLSIYKLFSR